MNIIFTLVTNIYYHLSCLFLPLSVSFFFSLVFPIFHIFSPNCISWCPPMGEKGGRGGSFFKKVYRIQYVHLCYWVIHDHLTRGILHLRGQIITLSMALSMSRRVRNSTTLQKITINNQMTQTQTLQTSKNFHSQYFFLKGIPVEQRE
jgi:hypothetical protein